MSPAALVLYADTPIEQFIMLAERDGGFAANREVVTAAVGRLDHRPDRVILIRRYNDVFIRAQVEIDKHVAAGKRRYQQVLGIVARRVTSECRIR